MQFYFQNKLRKLSFKYHNIELILRKKSFALELTEIWNLERFQSTIDKLHFKFYLKTDNNRVPSNHSHEFYIQLNFDVNFEIHVHVAFKYLWSTIGQTCI